jgi:hypothetical protein
MTVVKHVELVKSMTGLRVAIKKLEEELMKSGRVGDVEDEEEVGGRGVREFMEGEGSEDIINVNEEVEGTLRELTRICNNSVLPSAEQGQDDNLDSNSDSDSDSDSDSPSSPPAYSRCRAYWDSILTSRQKSLTLTLSSGSVIGASFWSQVNETSERKRGSAWEDERLYKDLLVEYVRGISQGDGGSPVPDGLGKGKKRKKGGKEVDRKGSKGRRIRYVKHPKIENFGIPTDRGGGEEQWFKSVFGGKKVC